jgi:hypothetical protein
MGNSDVPILITTKIGNYAYARPDYEKLVLAPTLGYIDPNQVVPFGLQKRLLYTNPHGVGGIFQKNKTLGGARATCFSELLSELEKMVSEKGADAVLVEITADREEKTSWLLSAETQLLLYK